MKKSIAFVQQNSTNSIYSDGKKFWSVSCDSAAKGFEKLGYKVLGFSSQAELPQILSRETPVRGSVQTFRQVLKHLGVNPPPNVDIPEELMGFAGRRVWTSTVGEVLSRKETVFVKPLLFQKDFPGHIAYNGRTIRRLNLPNNYPILCQDVTDFHSGELRVYVIEGKIVGKYFSDLFTWTLSSRENSMLKTMLATYKSQPAGFCLDVARKKNDNKLVLIEVNEGFSCGNYGLPHKVYAEMIEARWRELVSK